MHAQNYCMWMAEFNVLRVSSGHVFALLQMAFLIPEIEDHSSKSQSKVISTLYVLFMILMDVCLPF